MKNLLFFFLFAVSILTAKEDLFLQYNLSAGQSFAYETSYKFSSSWNDEELVNAGFIIHAKVLK